MAQRSAAALKSHACVMRAPGHAVTEDKRFGRNVGPATDPGEDVAGS